MLNHFHTFLMNQTDDFFSSSLLRVFVEPGFKPSSETNVQRKIGDIIFGSGRNSSLMDYRFFEFLRLIRACNLYEHVLRFDKRETYELDEVDLADDWMFTSRIQEGPAVEFYSDSGGIQTDLPMRVIVSIVHSGDGRIIARDERFEPLAVSEISGGGILLSGAGLVVRGVSSEPVIIDVRNRPNRSIGQIINEAVSLESNEYFEFFNPLRKKFPEYEEGFRNVTDTMHRFCLLVLAYAINNELRQGAA